MEFLRLKKANCRNCYKCIRHCPVQAIRFSGEQAHIVTNECILCGECFVVCPQDAKEIVSGVEVVKALIQTGKRVVVSLAPSFIANYPNVGIEGMRKALKQLGFAEVEETAIGATIVKKEYDRLLNTSEKDVLISSCCAAVNLLIRKHYPKMLEYLAPVLTPMEAHCQDIKRRDKEALTVFIGPCVAKKEEAYETNGLVDGVLTFEELSVWLKDSQISLDQIQDVTPGGKARLFPVAGGIIRSMDHNTPGYTYITVDGTQNCIAALHDLEAGKIHHCFIEMSACQGSCVRGPVMEKYHPSLIRDYISVNQYAGTNDFKVKQYVPSEIEEERKAIPQDLGQPTEEQLLEVMHLMGKNKPQDELNCGSCGYNTCKEKAVAIFQGKAEVSMCLPLMRDKAERFSDTLLNNTPNGIMVLNQHLEVQQINKIACRILNIRDEADIIGEPVERVMAEEDFIKARDNGQPIVEKAKYLAPYDRYVSETITYDPEFRVLVGIFRDQTQQHQQEQEKAQSDKETIKTADEVVAKQMRVAQDIAALLGETTAETKIALTKLKESIHHE